MFEQKSYNLHQNWYDLQFPTLDSKAEFYQKHQLAGRNHMAYWLQNIFYKCLDPLLHTPASWLTIGDAYGFDAQFILGKGSSALATDLTTSFLQVAREYGIIDAIQAANAEALPFEDNQFDYVLCKESYHHFPRPYAALYEMTRVARKGIIIMEPQDPLSKIPFLLMASSLFSGWGGLMSRIWKNRFSYEPVGNFVYKVSEREFEKFAAGLNLPQVFFKSINPNFYFKGADKVPLNMNPVYLKAAAKKWTRDQLAFFKLLPSQVLCTVVMISEADSELVKLLQGARYKTISIPKNPYL